MAAYAFGVKKQSVHFHHSAMHSHAWANEA